jgi:uncharacterized protein YhbP (UPF0306 family)
MTHVTAFLVSQQIVALATQDAHAPWVANLYYASDDSGKFYVVSPESSRHCQHVLKNPQVAFAVAWANPSNPEDRKGIQGTGAARLAASDEVAYGLALYGKKFPALAGEMTPEWIRTNKYGSRLWVVTPTYLKYWDDALYGDEESKEFHL